MSLKPKALLGRRWRALAFAVAAFAAAPSPAAAQAFPARAIQLVVAAPAGGPSDALARMLGEEMAKALGQPIVIDNKPGAGGTIAAMAVARAAPDGYTLLLSWIGNATSRSLLPKVRVDINRDFTHIVMPTASAARLTVRNSATLTKTWRWRKRARPSRRLCRLVAVTRTDVPFLPAAFIRYRQCL